MIVFKTLLLIVSSLGYTVFYNHVWRQAVLVTPFLTICTVTLFLYAFGVAGLLLPGAMIALAAGLVLGAYTIFRKSYVFKFNWQTFFSCLIVLIPPVLFYFAIPSDFVFLEWDELSFWAKCQRLIYDTDSLLTRDSPIPYKSYPPAAPLFQYYLTVGTHWSEKNVLFAQAFFCFSAIAAMCSCLIRRPVIAALIYLSCCCLIYFFNGNYVTVYSDGLLAICFAACLALACKDRTGRTDDLTLMICLCVASLIKETAVLLLTVVLVVYVVNVVSESDNRAQKITHPSVFRRLVSSILICGGPVIIVLLVWRWYASTIAAPVAGLEIPLHSTFGHEAFRLRLGTTVVQLVERLLQPGYFKSSVGWLSINLSLASFSAILSLLSVCVVLLTQRLTRLKIALMLQILLVGFVGYIAFLLLAYLFFFTEYEGVRLASFERYSLSYVLMWALFILVLFGQIMSRLSVQTSLLLSGMLLCLTVYFVPSRFITDFTHIKLDTAILGKRKQAVDLANIVKKYIQPNERVYFIAQNTNGYEKQMFDYSMMPYPPANCWSVGQRYGTADVWTCPEPLFQLLKGYRYLVVYQADQEFWETQRITTIATEGPLAPGVFRVNSMNEGGIQVTRLE
jgi:hypothetical protein